MSSGHKAHSMPLNAALYSQNALLAILVGRRYPAIADTQTHAAYDATVPAA